ncbi:MAG: methyltransferase [Acidobacteriota bacterium]|nr:methyltransferase [Acidobacteriota bacterium]
MLEKARAYENHLADAKVRLERLLAPFASAQPIDLRPSRIDDGFRGHARFSVSAANGHVSVTGVDPLVGRSSWESTLWILPGFAQRLVKIVIKKIGRDHLRYPVRGFDLRLGCGTSRAHVVVAVDRTEHVSFAGWAKDLLEEAPAVSGVSVPSQGLQAGDALIRHHVLGKDVFSHPLAFFQTNYWLTEALLRHIASVVSRERATTLLDLYCGVGVHSLLGGHDYSTVVGVDSDRRAIAAARYNAKHLGRSITYEPIAAEGYLRVCPDRYDAVIVNPPRSGCVEGVIEGVAQKIPDRICLVCCSAEAHARDLQRFRKLGYEAAEHAAFDMFPFTGYVENVTVLFPI